jgi:rod shape-determining protein MreD
MHARSSGSSIIYLSLFIAMCFSVLPWTNQIATWMPNWTLLVLMYWSIALPHKVSIGTAFATGLLFDVLTGSSLGQNALIFSLTTFCSHTFYSRLRNYHVWQQAIFILFFLSLMQLLALWISQLSQQQSIGYHYFIQAVSSAVFWPLVFASLRSTRRRFKVQ